MPPELDITTGDPVPTSPLSNESVEALLSQLLPVLERNPQNCEIFTSVFKTINRYFEMQFVEIAMRTLQKAMRIHGTGAGSLFNHTDSCPMYGDGSKLFNRPSDRDN